MNKFVDNIKERITDKFFIIAIAGMAVSCISIFFPIYKLDFGFVSAKVNYFYNDGEMADGVFILILSAVAFALLAFKKDPFAFIPLGLEALLLLNLYNNTSENELTDYTTIWFWLIILGVIAAIVGVVLLVVNKNNENKTTAPKTVDAKYEEVKKEENVFCSSCGKKKNPGSAFCSGCGKKF